LVEMAETGPVFWVCTYNMFYPRLFGAVLK
jgi:hypothetical protein